MTEEGKKKKEATSSVHDVRDKSQIRSESEFPLRSRPFNLQLGPCRHMTHVFRGREVTDAAKTVRLPFFSLAAVTVCSRLEAKRSSGGKIFNVSSGPNITGLVRPLVPDWSAEEHRILEDDGESGPERRERKLTDVNPIDDDLPCNESKMTLTSLKLRHISSISYSK